MTLNQPLYAIVDENGNILEDVDGALITTFPPDEIDMSRAKRIDPPVKDIRVVRVRIVELIELKETDDGRRN